jgi:hypothetical protein
MPASVVARSPAIAGRRRKLEFIIEEKRMLKFKSGEECEHVIFHERGKEALEEGGRWWIIFN